MTSKGPVSFHDDPPSKEESNKFKDALNKAKQAQREKPKDMENVPRFDQTGTWREAPQQQGNDFLSPETKRGLEAMARAAKDQEKQQAQQPTNTNSAVQQKPQNEETVELTQEEKLKKAIESRLAPIDIGQYLMSGEVKQEIIIVPGKLEVVFKSVTDLEESYVDTVISKEPGTLSNRQFLRKMNELALCIHLHSVNGNKWPTVLDGDGTINEQAVESRLRHIHKLSSPVFNMLTQNLSWFIERINDSLTASALGNG